ncbi:hypothetical protein L226DRAFT_615473 [Lentinus tigrinus ALCF2SS1-7]|uniref:ARM repeat-containing protein n=1 Tax=Lentinus tigrinus ALCF2SS1-6 TaxID=1328759 RepID=A0A5C2RZF0_9APHY|nr:hypothetical protein L227DRAFT_656246 [Lentinus tigrinus ALCF2SS1-6]RPD71447.1 hypothetical protein L226DRAFT_615473 [Lentinus tigrinus ALCF2SS1-7]
MQRTLLTRQPSINCSYVSIEPVIGDVVRSSSIQDAERCIQTAFHWLGKNLRNDREFRRIEKQLENAFCGNRSPTTTIHRTTTDPEALKGGIFVTYCIMSPVSLLNERLHDDAWLTRLKTLLESPKSRSQTCEALLWVTRLDGCDTGHALNRMRSILSKLPDDDCGLRAIIQATSHLILSSPEGTLEHPLGSDGFRIAYETIEGALVRDPPRLSLLPDIFQCLRLTLWAARDGGEEYEGLMMEILPALLAFTRSRLVSIRSLAVTALLSLAPAHGPFDGCKIAQAERTVPSCSVNDELPRCLPASAKVWRNLVDSPFATFLAGVPTNEAYRGVMAQLYLGALTNWRSLAFALVELIDPVGVETQGMEMNDIYYNEDYPTLDEITNELVNALEKTRDPEAASILRLRAALAKGRIVDALAQAREAARKYPACAFAQCVLSLFPDHAEGLKAAQQGLASVKSPYLRQWLIGRFVVHAGARGLSLFSGIGINKCKDPAADLTLLESAVERAQALLRKIRDDGGCRRLREQSLFWYILLNVALHGSCFPSSATDFLVEYEPSLSPDGETPGDCWLRRTPYNEREILDTLKFAKVEWPRVVDRIDKSMVASEKMQKNDAR